MRFEFSWKNCPLAKAKLRLATCMACRSKIRYRTSFFSAWRYRAVFRMASHEVRIRIYERKTFRWQEMLHFQPTESIDLDNSFEEVSFKPFSMCFQVFVVGVKNTRRQVQGAIISSVDRLYLFRRWPLLYAVKFLGLRVSSTPRSDDGNVAWKFIGA